MTRYLGGLLTADESQVLPSNNYENTSTMSNLVNVTDTSNVKVKFASDSFASGSGLQGDTNYNQTIIRL